MIYCIGYRLWKNGTNILVASRRLIENLPAAGHDNIGHR